MFLHLVSTINEQKLTYWYAVRVSFWSANSPQYTANAIFGEFVWAFASYWFIVPHPELMIVHLWGTMNHTKCGFATLCRFCSWCAVFLRQTINAMFGQFLECLLVSCLLYPHTDVRGALPMGYHEPQSMRHLPHCATFSCLRVCCNIHLMLCLASHFVVTFITNIKYYRFNYISKHQQIS